MMIKVFLTIALVYSLALACIYRIYHFGSGEMPWITVALFVVAHAVAIGLVWKQEFE